MPIPEKLNMERKTMLMILSHKLSQQATVTSEAGDMVFMASFRVSGRLEVMRLYPVTVRKRIEMWALTGVAEWTIPRITSVR